MRANLSGTWYPVKKIYGHNGTSFIEGDFWWKYDASNWHQIVPPNAVTFYTSSTQYAPGGVYKAFVADGTNGTQTLTDKFISASTDSVLGTGGATTHAGTDHSSTTVSINSANNTYDLGTTGGLNSNLRYDSSTHTHGVGSTAHQHTGTGTNLNLPHTRWIPTMYGDKLFAGAIVFKTSQQTSGSIIYSSSYNGYYLRMYSSYTATVAGASHNHGPMSGTIVYTDYFTYSTTANQWDEDSYLTYTSHRHYINHSDGNITSSPAYTTPPYFDLIPHVVQADMFFDELPDGSLMFFTTTTLPKGWSRITYSSGSICRLNSTNGTTGGSHNHTHTYSGSTSYISTATTSTNTMQGTSAYRILDHAHPMSSSHTWTGGAGGTTTPPYVNLVLAGKNLADIAAGDYEEDTLCALIRNYVSNGATRSCSSWSMDNLTYTNYKWRNISVVGVSTTTSSQPPSSYSVTFTCEFSNNGGGSWSNITVTTALGGHGFSTGQDLHVPMSGTCNFRVNTGISFT